MTHPPGSFFKKDPMNGPEIEDFLAMCQSKGQYRSPAAAGRAAEYAHQNGSKDKLRVYQCPICTKFHLTSKPLEDFAR